MASNDESGSTRVPSIIPELFEIGGARIINELLARWHDRDAERLESLRALVDRREAARARALAHALKGAAAGTGFVMLEQRLSALEADVIALSWARAQSSAEQLAADYARDRAAVEAALQRLAAGAR